MERERERRWSVSREGALFRENTIQTLAGALQAVIITVPGHRPPGDGPSAPESDGAVRVKRCDRDCRRIPILVGPDLNLVAPSSPRRGRSRMSTQALWRMRLLAVNVVCTRCKRAHLSVPQHLHQGMLEGREDWRRRHWRQREHGGERRMAGGRQHCAIICGPRAHAQPSEFARTCVRSFWLTCPEPFVAHAFSPICILTRAHAAGYEHMAQAQVPCWCIWCISRDGAGHKSSSRSGCRIARAGEPQCAACKHVREPGRQTHS